MKEDKRTLLKLSLTSALLARWVTPSIVIMNLPAHAETSLCLGDTYNLEIIFTGVNRGPLDFCIDCTDQEIIDGAIKPGPIETFCISDEEITAGEFDRSTSLGPDGGMAADFLIVIYTIVTVTNTALTGSIVTSNVDTLISLNGTWTAMKSV